MAEGLDDRGLLAEFADEHELGEAVAELLDEGFTALETFTPYPVAGVTDRLGPRPAFVTRAAGIGAVIGASLAYWLQWYLNGYLYPLDVGGRPYHSIPALVPITFELGVLFTALTAFFAALGGAGLVRLWRPVFEVEGIERASIDRFFLLVDAGDPRFDPELTRERLLRFGPVRVLSSGRSSR